MSRSGKVTGGGLNGCGVASLEAVGVSSTAQKKTACVDEDSYCVNSVLLRALGSALLVLASKRVK